MTFLHYEYLEFFESRFEKNTLLFTIKSYTYASTYINLFLNKMCMFKNNFYLVSDKSNLRWQSIFIVLVRPDH